MKIIGVTGGIGSGKSTICKVLEKLGYPVFYSDLDGRDQLNGNSIVHQALEERYGKEIFDEQGLPNRPAIAKIVFQDKDELQWINQLIHPLVKESFENWAAEQESALVFMESAILFEGTFSKQCDFSVQVSCDEESRILRVHKRDDVDMEDIRNRMRNQMSDMEREKRADFIIYNEDHNLVIPQLLDMLQEILKR
jgi:dephospho-CoA kinase